MADRAEAAPWTDYPTPPWWYPSAFAGWSVALLACLTADDDAIWSDLGVLVLVLLEVGFLVRMRRSWGTWPRMGSMPPELHRAAVVFVAAAVALVGVVSLLQHQLGLSASGPVLAVGIGVLVSWYNDAYAGAARRTSQRVA